MFLFQIIRNGGDIFEVLLNLLSMVLAATAAIVLHEVAHGYAALLCGDPTAKFNKRLTLNPAKHFDLLGVIMLLLVGFGWAKPVPINPDNFRNRKKGMLFVSAAGVITNLFLGGLCLLLLFVLYPLLNYNVNTTAGIYALKVLIFAFLVYAVKINFMLAFFNFLPIYPLDGYQFLNTFLPPYNSFSDFMKRYGMYVLLALIILSNVLDSVGLEQFDIFYWANYLINLLIEAVI